MAFGEILIYLSKNWIWVMRIFLFTFLSLLMIFVANKSKSFKIKKKEVKYHLFFSLIFVISYAIIYAIVANIGYMMYQPLEADVLNAAENIEDVSIGVMEQFANKTIKFDLLVITPLTIMLMLVFLTFLIKEYYKLNLKNSFKLALLLVVFYNIMAWLLAIPDGILFVYIQTHPVLQYLY